MKKIVYIFTTMVAVMLFSFTAFAGSWEQDAKGWRYRITENDKILDVEKRLTDGDYVHRPAKEYPDLLNQYAAGADVESRGEMYHINGDGYMATNKWYFDGARTYIYYGADGIAQKFENNNALSEYPGPVVRIFDGNASIDAIPTMRQINDGRKLIHILDFDNTADANASSGNSSIQKYKEAQKNANEESYRNCFIWFKTQRMYRDENGSFPKNCWYWVSGTQMPEKKANIITDDWLCYCFDENGMLYRNCTTPDGKTVNDYGQLVVDGVIQTKSIKDYPQRPASTPIHTASTYSYKDANGNTPKNCWYWISGKAGNDAVSNQHKNDWLCYCFDANGQIYKNCQTPDGYYVNENGQWVINGVVQSKSMYQYPQRPASMPIGSATTYSAFEEFNY